MDYLLGCCTKNVEQLAVNIRTEENFDTFKTLLKTYFLN